MAKSKEEKSKAVIAEENAIDKKKIADAAKAKAKKEASDKKVADKALAEAKAKAKKEDAEAKKAIADAKKAEKAEKDAQNESEKLSRVSEEAYELFRIDAISKRWKMHSLQQEAFSRFGKENVTVEKLNNRQVSFTINKKRIPKDGFFTVE